MKASPEPISVGDRLKRLIANTGPIPVADYMAIANAHYYATRDPLGTAGDFTTAPEISQMFGELVGVWLADLWVRAGRRPNVCYVELGPGRGTLASDAMRAMRAAGLEPEVHFVEASPVLKAAQAKRMPSACWHDDVSTLPDDAPMLMVANEFFDALPVRQLIATENGWHELVVTVEDGRFVRIPGHPAPFPLPTGQPGTMFETSPASAAIIGEIARRLTDQGGAALIVDYGRTVSGTGDTLQAVEKHGFADPWDRPGERDLTAHVDFQALGEAAVMEGVRVIGAVGQGQWLREMGIESRAAALAQAAPQQAQEIDAARERLTATEQMGVLFKVMALVAPAWPAPAGFG